MVTIDTNQLAYEHHTLSEVVRQLTIEATALRNETENLKKQKAKNDYETQEIRNQNLKFQEETERLRIENENLKNMNQELMVNLENQKNRLAELYRLQEQHSEKQKKSEEFRKNLELQQVETEKMINEKDKLIEEARMYAAEKEKELEQQKELERIRLQNENEELEKLKEIERVELAKRKASGGVSENANIGNNLNINEIQGAAGQQNINAFNTNTGISAGPVGASQGAFATGTAANQQPYSSSSANAAPSSKEDNSDTVVSRKTQGSIKGEILQNMEELDMITKKINKNNKTITYNLIYKATVDGDTAKSFHKRCDNAKSTLVLVEDTNGKRFGGFTTQNWEGDAVDKVDNDAFVFSLDKMEIYDIIQDELAIGCYPKYGPVFFGCQIRIMNNFFTMGGTTYQAGLNYQTPEDFVLTGGNQKFIVKELEVYEVTIE